MRVSRPVVRPGRKNGGTTLSFRLTRGAVLRITIVRVYPRCKQVGSFRVRGHAGMNQIRFRGRYRGRSLPQGGYRLIIRAVGAEKDAAAVPVVIARGKMRGGELRKARSATVCSEPIADLGDFVPASFSSGDGSSGNVATAIKDRLGAPFTAASAIARKAKGLTHRLKDAGSNAADNPFVLTLIGLVTLASALLGALVLTQVLRSTGYRGRPLH